MRIRTHPAQLRLRARAAVLFAVTHALWVCMTVFFICAAGRRAAASEPEPLAQEILSNVFRSHCISCHGKWKREGDLDLRTRASMLRGGRSGPAIVPGKPEESLVYQRIVRDEMPPEKDLFGDKNYVRRVRAGDIDRLAAWIRGGAQDEPPVPAARDEVDASSDVEGLWALKPPRRVAPPVVLNEAQVRTPIDAFLLQQLEAKNLRFSPKADRSTQLRRAHFALTGLPPSAAAATTFAADTDPGSYERLVDELLATQAYGERWAMYWLDAAGYADTHGKIDRDEYRRYAWRYRDYVIRALVADKPYDRFLLEQVAGDELVEYRSGQPLTTEKRDALIATGFLRTAADDTDELALNFVPSRQAVLIDELKIFGSAVMGMTIECAQCHDHKFDPISLRDYYRFMALFQPAYDPYDWRIPGETIYPSGSPAPALYQRLLDDPGGERLPVIARHNAPLLREIAAGEAAIEEVAAPFKAQIVEERLAALEPAAAARARRIAAAKGQEARGARGSETAEEAEFKKLFEVSREELEKRFPNFRQRVQPHRARADAAKRQLLAAPKIHALFDTGGEPTPVYVLRRGELRSPGERVAPGVPPAFSTSELQPFRVAAKSSRSGGTGRRLGLAKWLIQPRHPLTARVIVNRIWQHHFGRGLVATPANFGNTGAPPSHPELLDWLASEFVRQGWSFKTLHRLIMTSTAYRQRSLVTPEALAADPENVLLSRFPLRRLDAEAIRDSVLQVTGALDRTPFGPPDDLDVTADGEATARATAVGYRRSIYLIRRRLRAVTQLDLFDAPRMQPNCVRRVESTVPTQALRLWNSRFVRDGARRFAAAVFAVADASRQAQLERIYLTAYGRLPSGDEVEADSRALDELAESWFESAAAAKRRGTTSGGAVLENAVRKDAVTGGAAGDQAPAETEDTQRALAHRQALEVFCHSILNSPEFLYVD